MRDGERPCTPRSGSFFALQGILLDVLERDSVCHECGLADEEFVHEESPATGRLLVKCYGCATKGEPLG